MTDWMKYPVCGHVSLGRGWIRILGYGIGWKDTARIPLCFSERVLGHGFQIGRYRVRFFKPNGC